MVERCRHKWVRTGVEGSSSGYLSFYARCARCNAMRVENVWPTVRGPIKGRAWIQYNDGSFRLIRKPEVVCGVWF
jgi:hypothetical protein